MGNERLSGLALIPVHRDITIDVDTVITKYAMRHPRRMAMINILDAWICNMTFISTWWLCSEAYILLHYYWQTSSAAFADHDNCMEYSTEELIKSKKYFT